MTAIRIVDDHLELGNIGSNTHAQIDTGLTKLAGIESGATADQTKADIDGLGLSHDSLVDVSANDHHNELHSIASHNDTSATGAQLDILTDNSIADTLHRHSELVASDGSPDPVLSVDATGQVGIGGTPDQLLTVMGGWVKIKDTNYPQYVMLSDLANAQEWSFFCGSSGFAIRNRTNSVNPLVINNDAPAASLCIESDSRIGLGTNTPATSAKLELLSTTGALLLSRMTTTQKNALTAVNGMVLYDSTLNKFQGYENGSWTSLI